MGLDFLKVQAYFSKMFPSLPNLFHLHTYMGEEHVLRELPLYKLELYIGNSLWRISHTLAPFTNKPFETPNSGEKFGREDFLM